LTTGDSGVVFVGNSSYINASGQVTPYYINSASTVSLLIQLDTKNAPAHETFPMTIAPDGYSASYVTTGVEFPIGGIYNITMRISLGSSRLTADQPVRYRVDDDFIP
jgi:hypothetical protein